MRMPIPIKRVPFLQTWPQLEAVKEQKL